MPEQRRSRNDIRDAARRFALDWSGDFYERGEAQSFWTEFLEVFGVQRRRVNAAFERHARRSSTGGAGFIDLLWPGMLLAEHKSRGQDLDAALDQALDYVDGLDDSELPRLVVVSDFARLRVLDMDDDERTEHEFTLPELADNIDRFLTLAGFTSRQFEAEDAVNLEAAELLAKVYDEIAATGYGGHRLRVFLVRLVFLLFGDDSGLWERNLFADLLENRTSEDGSDLGMWVTRLFGVLNEPLDQRTNTLDEDLAAFPHVNGGLFEEAIQPPDTTRSMRTRLLEAARFDWSKISPAIFGSIFQGVMDAGARHALGAHYTSETNILKVIEPLFLNGLREDLNSCGNSKTRLTSFHERLGRMSFMDPACGCGNFLVIAYRELRRLEREVLLRLNPGTVQMTTMLDPLRRVRLSQFAGIEIEEFPVRIAETAMYLIDHLENEELGKAFGVNVVDLPLTDSAPMYHGNALHLDWASVLPPGTERIVLGNPPYLGKKNRSTEQQADVEAVLGTSSDLDYVSCWFIRARELMAHDPSVRTAFVATNSITQGEQVPKLWPRVLTDGCKIDFAHRTFNWVNEGPGGAHVHCVIIGLSIGGATKPQLFDYADVDGTPSVRSASHINPYLADFGDVYVESRRTPLADVPAVRFGSMPNDGGHLLLDEQEADKIRASDPDAARFLRPLLSARQMLRNEPRFCLWLEGATVSDIRSSAELKQRVESVRDYRAASKRPATKKLSTTPALFGEIRQPLARYLAIPRHSSEHRRVIPMAFFDPDTILSDSMMGIEGADLWLFGVLQSGMFSAWVRTVGGRIKNDLRFSAEVVYNTFPFPRSSRAVDERIEAAAQGVLDARSALAGSTLADLYDPLAMPLPLIRAHDVLDRAVDSAYGKRAQVQTDAERLPLLFDRYQNFVLRLV